MMTAALPCEGLLSCSIQAPLSTGLGKNGWKHLSYSWIFSLTLGIPGPYSLSQGFTCMLNSYMKVKLKEQGLVFLNGPQAVLWLLLGGVHCQTSVGRMHGVFPSSTEESQRASWTRAKSCCPAVHRVPKGYGWMTVP